MKIILLQIALFSATSLSSQIDTISNLAIEATIAYRDHILMEAAPQNEFNALLERWKILEPNKEDLKYLLYNVFHAIQVYDLSLEKITSI